MRNIKSTKSLIGRKVFGSSVLLVVYGVVMFIWERALTQLQSIATAQVLNDDSVLGNAATQWFRSTDLVGIVLTVVLVVVLVAIWRPVIKKVSK